MGVNKIYNVYNAVKPLAKVAGAKTVKQVKATAKKLKIVLKDLK